MKSEKSAPAATPIAVLQQQGIGVRRRGRQSVIIFLCKTKPIYAIFGPKTAIVRKNKPNSNPKQTQSKPIQSQFKANSKPIQTQNKPKTNPILGQKSALKNGYTLMVRGLSELTN